jgi:hypothetical protein
MPIKVEWNRSKRPIHRVFLLGPRWHSAAFLGRWRACLSLSSAVSPERWPQSCPAFPSLVRAHRQQE